MECKKLEKKLQNWTRALSFKLADGSAPPINYFTLLSATPHRRQLWETLMELVQPRKKVEHMRKQIAVAKLIHRQKIHGKTDVGIADRIDLWHKQNELENKVESKKNEVAKFEGNIINKASDMLFEICSLSESEKFYEEYSERELGLRLLIKTEKDIIKSLEKLMGKVLRNDGNISLLETTVEKEILDLLKNEMLRMEKCMCTCDDAHWCELVYKLKKLHLIAMKETNLWEEMIKYKKSLLKTFSVFLNEISLNEKILLSKRELDIEKNLYDLVVQLKQKVTEKSLQVILNSAEEHLLYNEIERETENVLGGAEKTEKNLNFLDEIFCEPISPIKRNETSESLAQMEKVNAAQLKSVMKLLGLKSYEFYLREEKRRIENEALKMEKDKKCGDERKNEESSNKIQPTEIGFQSFECLVEEIFWRRSEEKALSRNIVRAHEKLMRAQRLMLEKTEQKKKTTAAENVDNLKNYSRRLIQTFMETPFDALRTVECTDSYGGGLKRFLSALLIPPEGNSQAVLSVVERRQKSSAEIENVIRQREELTRRQNKTKQKMSSIKWNTRLCERNFKDSSAILWNVLANAEEVPKRIDFIEKVLSNWVDQPYRFMIGNNLVCLYAKNQDCVVDLHEFKK